MGFLLVMCYIREFVYVIYILKYKQSNLNLHCLHETFYRGSSQYYTIPKSYNTQNWCVLYALSPFNQSIDNRLIV